MEQKNFFINTSVLCKTDSFLNWSSIEENFQTLKGELYFYTDKRDTGKRNHLGEKIYRPSLKIGNGNKLNEVPFLENSYITFSQIENLFGTRTGMLGKALLGKLTLGSSFISNNPNSNSLDSAQLDQLILG